MIKLQPGKFFFDSRHVMNRVDKATRSVLSKFGAYVRRTARRSIRKRKRRSRPGKPPSDHTGLLKRFIFFGYDPDKQSVVIGPEKLGKGEAPPALEYGGTSTVEEDDEKKQVRIKARPFMGPAYEKELPGLPQMWRDSVR